MRSLTALVDDAVRAATAGGRLVIAGSHAGGTSSPPPEIKGAGDYVTETDRASERVIREALAETRVPVWPTQAAAGARAAHTGGAL